MLFKVKQGSLLLFSVSMFLNAYLSFFLFTLMIDESIPALTHEPRKGHLIASLSRKGTCIHSFIKEPEPSLFVPMIFLKKGRGEREEVRICVNLEDFSDHTISEKNMIGKVSQMIEGCMAYHIQFLNHVCELELVCM